MKICRSCVCDMAKKHTTILWKRNALCEIDGCSNDTMLNGDSQSYSSTHVHMNTSKLRTQYTHTDIQTSLCASVWIRIYLTFLCSINFYRVFLHRIDFEYYVVYWIYVLLNSSWMVLEYWKLYAIFIYEIGFQNRMKERINISNNFQFLSVITN